MSWEHLWSYIEVYGEKYGVLSTQHQIVCIILEINPSAPDETLDNCNPSDILTTTSWEVLSHSCQLNHFLILDPQNLWETFSSVQSLSRVRLFVTPWTSARRPPCPSPTPGVHPNPCPLSWWCHPTISSCRPLLLLPSIFPSIRVFSNELTLHIKWLKYWSFSFNISPSNEHPGPISFRMDWLDFLAVRERIFDSAAERRENY